MGDEQRKFMLMALGEAKRSDCTQFKVGCIAVNPIGVVVGKGFNRGLNVKEDCSKHMAKYPLRAVDMTEREWHTRWSAKWEVHAEQAMVAYASVRQSMLFNSTVYSTLFPCASCAKLLVALGIAELVYLNEYDRADAETWDLFSMNDVKLTKFDVESLHG